MVWVTRGKRICVQLDHHQISRFISVTKSCSSFGIVSSWMIMGHCVSLFSLVLFFAGPVRKPVSGLNDRFFRILTVFYHGAQCAKSWDVRNVVQNSMGLCPSSCDFKETTFSVWLRFCGRKLVQTQPIWYQVAVPYFFLPFQTTSGVSSERLAYFVCIHKFHVNADLNDSNLSCPICFRWQHQHATRIDKIMVSLILNSL